MKHARPQDPPRSGTKFSCQIFPERRVVIVKFGKRVTQKEIAKYALSLRADPGFHPEFSEIVDLTQVQDLDLRGSEMMELADKIDPFSLEAKRAFVVKDLAQTHAAHIHQMLRLSKDKISIFRSLEEAERWLGLT